MRPYRIVWDNGRVEMDATRLTAAQALAERGMEPSVAQIAVDVLADGRKPVLTAGAVTITYQP